MLTNEQSIEIAEKFLLYMESKDGMETIILHEHTIEKAYGRIFYYTSKLYYETDDIQYAIAGNAPFLVENKSNSIIIFGTAYPIEYYIEGYENGTWTPSDNGIWKPKD